MAAERLGQAEEMVQAGARVREPARFLAALDCTSRASRESQIQPRGTAPPDRSRRTGSLGIPSLNIIISHRFVNATCPARGVFYPWSTYCLCLTGYADQAEKTRVCTPHKSLKAEDTQPIKQGISHTLLQSPSLTGSQSTSQP